MTSPCTRARNEYQRIFHNHNFYIPEWCNINYSDHAALQFISFHEIENQWADNVIMELTACMLQTPFFMYDNGQGWIGPTIAADNYYCFWNIRHQLKNLSEGPICHIERQQEALYVKHISGQHFEPVHTGLSR